MGEKLMWSGWRVYVHPVSSWLMRNQRQVTLSPGDHEVNYCLSQSGLLPPVASLSISINPGENSLGIPRAIPNGNITRLSPEE